MQTRRARAVALVVSALGLVAGALVAGPLSPPGGPVTGTHKTLTEVEPRIAINAANTPGDTNSLYKITQPGSYYLTGNITGEAGKHGIEIGATGVSIDLNGFELRGVAGSLDGITNTAFSIERIIVRNGTVRDWGGAGVLLNSNSFTGTVESVLSTNNGSLGIAVGNAYTVSRCIARANGSSGFSTPTSSVFAHCSSRNNGGNGFSVNADCTLSDCVASGNTGVGFSCGFPGNSLVRCTASSNLQGFSVGSEAMVSHCTARANTGDGIRAGTGCVIMSNNCVGNGAGAGDGAGIIATGTDNRIEGNTCTFADRGIDVDGAGNFIARNTCSNNTTNWSIVAGNICLVVQGFAAGAINGNTGGVAPGSTDPNANFTY